MLMITGVANAKYVSIAETSKNSRIWALTFTVDLTLSNGDIIKGKSYTINLNGNNANQDGSYRFEEEHDLAGYTLQYDIKGNGSNIKEFRIVI